MTDIISRTTVEAIRKTHAEDKEDVLQRLTTAVKVRLEESRKSSAPFSVDENDPYKAMEVRPIANRPPYSSVPVRSAEISNSDLEKRARSIAERLFYAYN